jgi:hypothetical protein
MAESSAEQETARAAVQAWHAEAIRLLSLPDLPDDLRKIVSTASEAMSQRVAEVDQRKERRRAPVSRTATNLGVALASEFLSTVDLVSLGACSRATQKLAAADAAWSAHTARDYPEAAQLRAVTGALTGRPEYVRMQRLLGRRPRSIPGIEAYSALVIFKYRGVTIIDGLFDMKKKIDHEGFAIEFGEYDLEEHRIVDREEPADVSITVCVVRKIDGKCMRFITNARGLSLKEDGFMRERGSFLELYLRGCDFFDRDDEGGYRLRRIGAIEMELLNTQTDCTEELLRLWAFADSWM